MSLFACEKLLQIETKPIMNKKIGEPSHKSLKKGMKFEFKTKERSAAIALDMVAVLFGRAMALLPIFATDILHVGSMGFGVLRAAPAVGSFITIIIMAYFTVHKRAGMK